MSLNAVLVFVTILLTTSARREGADVKPGISHSHWENDGERLPDSDPVATTLSLIAHLVNAFQSQHSGIYQYVDGAGHVGWTAEIDTQSSQFVFHRQPVGHDDPGDDDGVPSARLPPIITYGPVPQAVPTHGAARLPCAVVSRPSANVDWFRDHIAFDPRNNDAMHIADDGALLIQDAYPSMSGYYTCIVTDGSFSSSAGASLIIADPNDEGVEFYGNTDPVVFPSAPNQLSVIALPNSRMSVSWQPPDTSGYSDISGYIVESFAEGRSTSWIEVADTPSTSIILDLVYPNGAFTYLVRAYNSFGKGPPSDPAGPVLATPPA